MPLSHDPKPDPNHDIRIRALARMTPEQRLAKACELSDMVRALFKEGLRARFPDMPEAELHKLYLERLKLSYDRQW